MGLGFRVYCNVPRALFFDHESPKINPAKVQRKGSSIEEFTNASQTPGRSSSRAARSKGARILSILGFRV